MLLKYFKNEFRTDQDSNFKKVSKRYGFCMISKLCCSIQVKTLCNMNSIVHWVSFEYLSLRIASLVTAFLYDFIKGKKALIKYSSEFYFKPIYLLDDGNRQRKLLPLKVISRK